MINHQIIDNIFRLPWFWKNLACPSLLDKALHNMSQYPVGCNTLSGVHYTSRFNIKPMALDAFSRSTVNELQANTDRILPGFRALMNLPTLPGQIV